MKGVNKFLRKVILITSLYATILITLLYLLNIKIERIHFNNGETESNLLVLDENKKRYKYVMCGISHARNFSRYNHHSLFESKKGSMINIGQGGDLNGFNNQYLYLRYFFETNYKADTLLFVLSPTLFYRKDVDDNAASFFQEPIRFDFAKLIYKNGGDNKYQQLFYYAKSKLSHHWWNSKPIAKGENRNALSKIDTSMISEGMKIAYPFGRPDSTFKERAKIFDQIISLANKYNTSVKIIVPPALFGKWPDHDKIIDYIKKYNVPLIDLSESILQPQYYYDHHHLNTKGIKKILDQI
jgi:hypothetical protein